MSSQNGNGRLAGKTAVITGGSSGLGLETARHFVAQGARVVITGQNEERLGQVRQELGDAVIPVRADVRSLDDLDRLAETVKASFGTLDILFANAGLGNFGPVSQVDERTFDTQFDTNVKGLFFTVQKLVGLMGTGGSIILNASAVNSRGKAGASVYFATKAAVRSLARSLADEFGPQGIRVNALSPGLVPTGFQAKTGLAEEDLDTFGKYVVGITPLGRVGRPDEIAHAAVFLASDESSYMTASDLVVDGGYMNV